MTMPTMTNRSWSVLAGVGATTATVLVVLAALNPNDFMRVALPGYLTAIGTLALAGTTVWLRHKDEGDRRFERSRIAAFTIDRSTKPLLESLRTLQPNQLLDLGDWYFDVATYGSDLVDPEVARRLNEVTDRLSEFADWNRNIGHLDAEKVAAALGELKPRRRELRRYLSWLGQTLAAHRNERPLPDLPTSATTSQARDVPAEK